MRQEKGRQQSHLSMYHPRSTAERLIDADEGQDLRCAGSTRVHPNGPAFRKITKSFAVELLMGRYLAGTEHLHDIQVHTVGL